MERIVIASENRGNDDSLIDLLNSLFPECEIYYVFPIMDGFEEGSNGSLSEFHMTDERGGNHVKYFGRR